MPEEEPTESPEMTTNMSFETQTDENESIVSCPSVPSTSAVSSALSISINKDVNLFECDICDILLTRRDYLDRHVKSCHPNEFECQICNSQLSTFHYLMRHMHTAHATFKMIYNEYGCKQCHKQFSESENLALHIANKHSGKNTHNASINCNYCGMQFGNEKHKTRHSTLKGHNYMLKLMSRRKIQFNLEESNHIDQSKEANFKYLPAKLNDRHFECRICLKSFPVSDLHIFAMLNLKTINNISFIFQQKRKATAHVKNHKEVFIYRCTQCNYTFLEKRVLDKHFGQYHKEAASQIEQLKNLNDHNNTMPELAHSTLSDDIFTPPAPKKLRMSLPNQALTTGDLPAHDASSFILRGPKGKSQCKVCSLLFNKRSDIMLHFKTHPEIPHATCTLCGFISVNQSYLNRHMKTTHGVVLGPDGVSFSSIEPKDERVPEPVPVPVPVPEPRPLINAQTMRDMQKRRMTRLSIAVSARYLVSEDPITEPITATKVPEKAQEPTKVIETAPEVKKIIPEASKETKLREIPTILSNGVEDLSVSAITTIDLLSDSEDVEDSLPSSSKSIACKICKRNFLRIDNLQNHIRHAHLKNNSENKCGVCENILDSPDLLVEHLRKHQDDNHKFICVICDKRYGVKNSLNRHNSQWHFKTNPEKDRPYYKQSSYKLTYFANPDAETGNVAKNEDSVGVAKGVPPAKVKKTLNVIPVSAANGFKIKFFKCNYCEKHFTRRDRMNLHRNVEHKKLIQDDQMRKKAKPVEEDDDSDELEESDEDSNAEDEVEAQKETTIANNIESNSTVMVSTD